MNKNNDIKISAIIPSGNSFSKKAGSIRHVIESLNIQNYAINEVVIVSNGKESDHSEIENFIRESIFNFRIKIIRAIGANLPSSRNIGADNASQNDYLMFLDDDTILNGEDVVGSALEDLGKSFADFFLGAKRLWTNPKGWFEQNANELLESVKNADFSELQINSVENIQNTGRNEDDLDFLKRTFIGNLGVIRKEIFEAVGGFDERFELFDDDLLIYRLSKKFTGVANKDISVFHVNHAQNSSEVFDDCLSRYENELSLNKDSDFCALQYIKNVSKR